LKQVALKSLGILEALGERASWLAIWAIVLLVFSQVFFRYVLNIGLSWPDEMARYFHIVIVFLCLGGVTRQNRHIRIDVISRRFAGPAYDIFQLFVLFFSAVVLTVGAVHVMVRVGHLRTPAAGMPIFLFILPALLGFVMVAFDCVRKLFDPRGGGSASEGTDRSEIT
jgi:TRAP-type C4-dicarboxylate transport system permease small subunit